jgi:mycoredoxin-dependent peroxiredoxin
VTPATGPGSDGLVGRPAPDFTARNQHGELVSMSGLRGRPAVLIFYPWAFSSICRAELAAIRDDHDRFTAAGARVLAISCDAMFTLRAYADIEHIGFDLLSDHWPHGAIARAYEVFDEQAGCALRGSFVLNTDGMVTWAVLTGIGEPRDLAELLKGLAHDVDG